VFTIIVSLGVARYLDWNVALNALSQVSWPWMLAALGVFCINYILRTIRFTLLMDSSHGRFTTRLGVVSLYGMFTYLLPVKSGELAYPVLALRHLQIPLSQSTAALITARCLDFGFIALVLPFIVLVLHESLPPWLIYLSMVYCTGAVTFGSMLLVYLRRSGTDAMLTDGANFSSSIVGRLSRSWHRLLRGLREIHGRGQYARLLLSTTSIWLCVYCYYYCIVVSIGFDASWMQMMVVSVFMVPMALFPIQGVANIGTHEAAWTAAFAVFGYAIDTSLTVAVTTHVVLFILVLLQGGAGLILISASSATRTQCSDEIAASRTRSDPPA